MIDIAPWLFCLGVLFLLSIIALGILALTGYFRDLVQLSKGKGTNGK